MAANRFFERRITYPSTFVSGQEIVEGTPKVAD